MNHTYRLVFNASLNAWVAVAETAKSRRKGGKARAIAAAVATLFACTGHALPTDGSVSAGAGTIAQSGNTMTITQASQHLALNWRSFNIAAPETVNFVQPNSSAADKTYDGTITATVTPGTLSGLVGSETVTVSANGTFDTPSVGSNKPVTTRYTLGDGANGGRGANYSLADETLAANIHAAPAPASATSAESTYRTVIAAVQQLIAPAIAAPAIAPVVPAAIAPAASSAGSAKAGGGEAAEREGGARNRDDTAGTVAAAAAGTGTGFLVPGLVKVVSSGMRLPAGLRDDN